jgi:hypothetical protein
MYMKQKSIILAKFATTIDETHSTMVGNYMKENA